MRTSAKSTWSKFEMLRGAFEGLLRQNTIHCAVLNRYAGDQARAYLQNVSGIQEVTDLPFPVYVHLSRLPQSPYTASNRLFYYIMDVASLLPVCNLCVQQDSTVLDMCAAPGGKSFAILQLLSLTEGGLALNDLSASRMTRLKNVVRKCLPPELHHAVRFTRAKGENWGKAEPGAYDRVLVDAPCSSDRHKIEEKGTAKLYKNSERFAALQEKLLLNGLYAGNKGSRIVYSTCTLADRENDQVVTNVLAKAAENSLDIAVQECVLPEALKDYCNAERTLHGYLVSPSQNRNTGPMFVAVLQKNK